MSRQIPLARFLTEGVVIVLSILLAFSVDAWWGERQEDEAAAELARGLLADVRRSMEDLEEVRATNSRKRDSSLEARELLRSAEPQVSIDSVTTLLTQSGATARLTPVLRSYEQLVSTGLLRRLDPDVQSTIARWVQAQEVAREYFEQDLLDFRQIVAFPFWTQSEVAFDQMLRGYLPGVDLGEPREPHDWSTLHENRELNDILAMFAVLAQSAVEVYDEIEVVAGELDVLLVERYGEADGPG